ncbi:MAG: O-antigen ligase family protein [Mariprofundaceae bacterium]|nr:O-antigen ligase family protein [Mariprofundaceae bacterium]
MSSKRPNKKKTVKQQYVSAAPASVSAATISPAVDKSILLWVMAPLLLFGFMLNVRLFPMIAPNEEPKWALLILCGVWIGLAAIWVLWRRSSLPKLAWSWAGLALLFFYVLLAAGIFVAPNTTEGLIRFTFWLSCVAVFLTACWAWRHVEVFHTVWIWMITLGSFVFSFRYWQAYILDYGTPNYNVHVLFSPIGHVSFTGDVLVVLLPVLIYLLLTKSHAVLRILNWLSVCTITTILLLASSRGAVGGIVMGLTLLTLLSLRHWKFILSQPWRKFSHILPIGLLVSTLLASFIVYENLPYHYRDLARVSSNAENNGTVEYKPLTPDVLQPPAAEMWNSLRRALGARTPMYASATAMVMDAPIMGQGTGNFFTVYPGFSNRFPDFRDPLSSARTFTTNPHNVVLQIATQQGLIATVLFMGVLLLFWWRLSSSVWRKWDMWKAAGVMGVTAALFEAMFNHVFFNPASMFVFALFAGFWWAALKPMPIVFQAPSLPTAIFKPVLMIVAVLVILLSVWPTRWLISEWYSGSAMTHMRQPAIAAKEYQLAYAWDKDNFRAVFGVAQSAYQEKRYDDAIVYLEHFENIYPYNPPALNLLGAAYLMKGSYTEALAAFKRAVVILPDFKMAKQNLARSQALLRQQQTQKK